MGHTHTDYWRTQWSKKESPSVTDVLTGVWLKATQPTPANPSAAKKSESDLAVTRISPMKTVSVRRSCLEDLKRLKDLLNDGVLTDEEFIQEKK